MKIIKQLNALALIALMLATPALAATTPQQNTADALNYLGVGGADGYALDGTLDRSNGITLLVRLMGKEKEAQSGKYSHPFTDVPDWLDGYVAYSYEMGITNGCGDGKFLGDIELSDSMFLTMTLRALGYDDADEDAEYTWDNPYALAENLGLIAYDGQDTEFTYGDAMTIFWSALSVKIKGTDQQMQERLIDQGVFTAMELQTAMLIQQNGIDSIGGAGNQKLLDEFTYEDYLTLTAAEKQALFDQYFGTERAQEYIAWVNALKAEYNNKQNIIEIGNGNSVDLGEILDQLENGND